jgi:hypothetical protein
MEIDYVIKGYLIPENYRFCATVVAGRDCRTSGMVIDEYRYGAFVKLITGK